MSVRTKPRYTARTADKHVLYQESVQSVTYDAGYLDRLFQRLRGRRGHHFREDFCGTAALSCAWVELHRDHHAVGVDLCGDTLRWGKQNNLGSLSTDQRRRIQLINRNVLKVTRPQVDLLAAMNFSYFVFKTRTQLVQYFKTARQALVQDGVMVLDAFGGAEAQTILEETRRCKGFTYIWEHKDFNPVTNEILCHIHFKFRDGTQMRKAFTYDWRLWSLPELRELLAEAGFSHSEVHWEGTDLDSGEGNGVFRKTTKGEAIDSWVAYVIALV